MRGPSPAACWDDGANQQTAPRQSLSNGRSSHDRLTTSPNQLPRRRVFILRASCRKERRLSTATTAAVPASFPAMPHGIWQPLAALHVPTHTYMSLASSRLRWTSLWSCRPRQVGRSLLLSCNSEKRYCALF